MGVQALAWPRGPKARRRQARAWIPTRALCSLGICRWGDYARVQVFGRTAETDCGRTTGALRIEGEVTMRIHQPSTVRSLVISTLLILAAPPTHDSSGATPRKSTRASRSDAKSDHVTVELFQAMERGDIEVKLIPKDSKQSTVLIKNKLDKPLHIKLPAAFVGVPVLAQVGGFGDGGGRGGGRDGGGGGGGGNQMMGGGMMGGMGGMGMGGMGMGMGGMMNVGPAAVRKFKVATVCLEHGKLDPNPRIPYALKPIESYINDQAVIELCKMLGQGKIDQHAAQAVAWHLANGLSWQQLARKVKVRHLNGSTVLYFNARDLRRAYNIGQIAAHRASDQRSKKSPAAFDTVDTYRPAASGAR